MSDKTIFLIVLFFIVLFIKPAYIAVEFVDEDDKHGTLIGETYFIIAILLKIFFPKKITLLTGYQYDRAREILYEES